MALVQLHSSENGQAGLHQATRGVTTGPALLLRGGEGDAPEKEKYVRTQKREHPSARHMIQKSQKVATVPASIS